jgi:hypothetical protein
MAPMFAIRPAVALLLCSLLLLPGCAVVTVAGAVAGAAISVGCAVASTGVKVTGAVVEAAIDDDDEDDD